MAKFATLSALLLLAMVGLAAATTYTTITTTTIDEDDFSSSTNPKGRRQEGSCQEKDISPAKISHCGALMQCEGGRRHAADSLRMVVNPITPKSQCEEQHLKICCDQLEGVKEDCRCQAIEKLVMRQGTQQRREMMQMAQDLPNRCDMKPERCDMQQGPWF